MKYYHLHISKHISKENANYLRIILPRYSMSYDDAYRYQQSISLSNRIFVHILEVGVTYSFIASSK